MNIVVTGSREWRDEETIRAWLSRLPKGTRIAHGACRGADWIAASVAKELGFEVVPYVADWSNGPIGGPRRNQLMVDTERPRRVFAFPRLRADGQPEGGTWDCAKRALVAVVPVTICPPGSRP